MTLVHVLSVQHQRGQRNAPPPPPNNLPPVLISQIRLASLPPLLQLRHGALLQKRILRSPVPPRMTSHQWIQRVLHPISLALRRGNRNVLLHLLPPSTPLFLPFLTLTHLSLLSPSTFSLILWNNYPHYQLMCGWTWLGHRKRK